METIKTYEFIVPDEDFEEFLSEFSFCFSKDLKKTKLNSEKLLKLLQENHTGRDTDMLGSKLCGGDLVGIRKIRLPGSDGRGKRFGYRLIVLVVKPELLSYIIHIYDKKDKKLLSKSEKESLKNLLKNFNEFNS